MAMATITATTPLRMKLFVDTSAQRVLFAEASKEVVDFLISLLALPVGAVVTLLGNESVVGSIGSLYGSVESLERSYVQPRVDMDALLRPVILPPAADSFASLLRLPVPDPSARPPCPRCGSRLRLLFSCRNAYGVMLVSSLSSIANIVAAGGGGFVQGNMTYTVMDDLAVAPQSTISTIAVFNAMAVRDIGAVEERTVVIGYAEALKILKASFVLTDVFVRDRAPRPLVLAAVVSWLMSISWQLFVAFLYPCTSTSSAFALGPLWHGFSRLRLIGYCSDTIYYCSKKMFWKPRQQMNWKEEEPEKPRFAAPPAPCYSAATV